MLGSGGDATAASVGIVCSARDAAPRGRHGFMQRHRRRKMLHSRLIAVEAPQGLSRTERRTTSKCQSSRGCPSARPLSWIAASLSVSAVIASSSRGGSAWFADAHSQRKAAATASISAVTVSETQLELGQDFIVTWNYALASGELTTGDLTSFEFGMVECSGATNVQGCDPSTCSSSSAAEAIALCLRGSGCLDSDGSYNLTVPDTTGYLVGEDAGSKFFMLIVSLSSDPEILGCTTHGFEVVEPAFDEPDIDIDTSSGDTESGSPVKNGVSAFTLKAYAPIEDVKPGGAFTARWLYEIDGVAAEGNFAVDLYTCENGVCDDGR